jgi:hypothetical protein
MKRKVRMFRMYFDVRLHVISCESPRKHKIIKYFKLYHEMFHALRNITDDSHCVITCVTLVRALSVVRDVIFSRGPHDTSKLGAHHALLALFPLSSVHIQERLSI